MNSNKIIKHLFEAGKISNGFGLQHFGGKQYIYVDETGHFAGNIDCEKLGEIITYMTNEEIKTIMNNL